MQNVRLTRHGSTERLNNNHPFNPFLSSCLPQEQQLPSNGEQSSGCQGLQRLQEELLRAGNILEAGEEAAHSIDLHRSMDEYEQLSKRFEAKPEDVIGCSM